MNRWIMPIYAGFLWLVLLAAFVAQDIHDSQCCPKFDQLLKRIAP